MAALSYSLRLLKRCNVAKFHEELLQLYSFNLIAQRYYRGHKAHNIGRVFGLEKVKVTPFCIIIVICRLYFMV